MDSKKYEQGQGQSWHNPNQQNKQQQGNQTQQKGQQNRKNKNPNQHF